MNNGSTVLREDCLRRLRGGKDVTNTVKIITGMRRSGKSTVMRQFMEELKSSGIGADRIFLFDLESKEYDDVKDFRDLNAAIASKITVEGRVYVFLDEPQKVEKWERTVNSLMVDYDADIYITGSNAYLLSSDIATYISGRYVEIKMLPLSFKEYIELHPPNEKKSVEVRFADYMQYGSLPIIDPDAENKEFLNGQIEGVYNTVLVKDVLKRLKTKDVVSLEKVSKYLYSNVGNLTNTLNVSKSSGKTPTTIGEYIKALENAYLFYKVYRYDVKGKKILKSSEKYYASDPGMRNVVLEEVGSDTGRLLENIVFLELLRRGYNVTVGSYNDLEIDFAAQRPGTGTEYFQVTESLIQTASSEREIKPLDSVRDHRRKTILSLDRILKDPGNGIRHLNAIDWLLGEE